MSIELIVTHRHRHIQSPKLNAMSYGESRRVCLMTLGSLRDWQGDVSISIIDVPCGSTILSLLRLLLGFYSCVRIMVYHVSDEFHHEMKASL